MTQEEFIEILRKYRQGTCSENEKRLVGEWYASIGAGQDHSLLKDDDGQMEARCWSALNIHIQKGKRLSRQNSGRRILANTSSSSFSRRAILAAAFVCGVLLTALLLQSRSKNPIPVASYFREAVPYMKYIDNYGGKPMEVSLPDGSRVVLEDSARIYYPTAFNGTRREIHLQGEAFFDVKHDVHRLFQVFAGELVTTVHGTSFTITARPTDKSITVAVHTGKVSVLMPQKSAAFEKDQLQTILTPNQQVVYNRSENSVSKTLVKTPQLIVTPEEAAHIHFEEAPVADIFNALKKIYGVDIVFDPETFKKCVLTTSVSDGTIFSRIDIICKAIGATYTVENTQIVIHGSGCN